MENFAKNQEKEGENREKLGKRGKNQEGSLSLPLLTDRAGYASGAVPPQVAKLIMGPVQNTQN